MEAAVAEALMYSSSTSPAVVGAIVSVAIVGVLEEWIRLRGVKLRRVGRL